MTKSTSRAIVHLSLLVVAGLLVLLYESTSVSAVSLAVSTGKASYYTAPYTPSACYGYGAPPSNKLFAAAGDGNPNIWQDKKSCGRFYNIKCVGKGCRSDKIIQVKIVDRCPNGCQNRAFDLSYEAFNAIADPDVGVISVQYS